MYAIIKTGGKQYRVAKDDVIDVELLNKQNGDQVEFSDVLLHFTGKETLIGSPLVNDCLVIGEILEEVYGSKIMSVKYKRSHNEYRKFGHRQRYSRVKIKEIRGAKESRREKHGT